MTMFAYQIKDEKGKPLHEGFYTHDNERILRKIVRKEIRDKFDLSIKFFTQVNSEKNGFNVRTLTLKPEKERLLTVRSSVQMLTNLDDS